MLKHICVALLMVGTLFALPARSNPVTFDFDCVTGNCVNGGTPANHGVKPNSNKTQDITNIKNYMNFVFEAAGVDNSVTFINTGTKSVRSGTPDGHPGAGKPHLGNTDGATDRNEVLTLHPSIHTGKDTYLINHWNGSTSLDRKDRIVIEFENPIPWVAFDWEIFPQTSFGNADLTVLADGIQIFFRDLTTFRCSSPPLTTPAQLRNCQTLEVRAGDLGHFDRFDFNSSNPAWTGGNGVTTLEFVDWTHAPVGIDNLQVGQVPAPATIFLLGAGLASLGWSKRRKAAAGMSQATM